MLIPVMPEGSTIVCVSSNAGLGWQERVTDLQQATSTPNFDTARSWCEENLSGFWAVRPLKTTHQRLGGTPSSGPDQEWYPPELHQSRAHRYFNDGRLRESSWQGDNRSVRRTYWTALFP